MMTAIRRKKLFSGIAWMMFLVLCVSAAFADESAVDAEKNLAGYGLSPHDVLMEHLGFIPKEKGSPVLGSQDSRPAYLWFDITGDGCVDLFTGRMFGSGMVRIELEVYDPLRHENYILDGYDYNYLADSISEGRVIVIKRGPYGYGEPVTDVRGTVMLDNGLLIFVADPETDPIGSDDLFDPSQAAVSADQAARTASVFAREYLDAEYCDEIRISHIGLGEGPAARFCWLVSLYQFGQQKYIVYVNTETGEVENSFSVDEGIG